MKYASPGVDYEALAERSEAHRARVAATKKKFTQRAKARRVARSGTPRSSGWIPKSAKAKAPPKPSHCPICQLPFEPTGPRKAVYDHCHQGGHFRGWICCFDNRVLGMMADDPERLMRAAQYLLLDKARNPLPPVLSDPSFKRKI